MRTLLRTVTCISGDFSISLFGRGDLYCFCYFIQCIIRFEETKLSVVCFVDFVLFQHSGKRNKTQLIKKHERVGWNNGKWIGGHNKICRITCVCREDSDQPAHQSFCWLHEEALGHWLSIEHQAKSLIRLGRYLIRLGRYLIRLGRYWSDWVDTWSDWVDIWSDLVDT